MQRNIKISFDADGTLLHKESIRDYAKDLVSRVFEVWIVTARYADPNDYSKEFCLKYHIADISKEHQELFTVADECGISRDHIKFMNMEAKLEFFVDKPDFIWHLDDDGIECNGINKYTKTVGICCTSSNWKHKCERLIKRRLKNEENL